MWRCVFLGQSVNPSTWANRAFRAPISSDYRGSYIKDDVAQFILCWCDNSQSLKVVLPRTLPSFTALSVMMPLSTLTRNCGAGAGDDSVIAAPITVRISHNAFIALFFPLHELGLGAISSRAIDSLGRLRQRIQQFQQARLIGITLG